MAFWTIFAAVNLCIELGPPYFEIMGDHMWTSRGPACDVERRRMNLWCTFLFSMTFIKLIFEIFKDFRMRMSGRPALSWARLSGSGWWMSMASTNPVYRASFTAKQFREKELHSRQFREKELSVASPLAHVCKFISCL